MIAERKILGQYVRDLTLHNQRMNEPDGLDRPTNGVDQSGERLGIYRDGRYEDSMCGVRVAFRVQDHSLTLYQRYAPRQLKNQQYSETGKLNVEVKFAPFSCKRRRAPLRVRSNQPRFPSKLMITPSRTSRIEKFLSSYTNRYFLRYSWSSSPSLRSMSSSRSWRTTGWKAVLQLDR